MVGPEEVETFRLRRSRARREGDRVNCYLDMRGRVSLAEVLAQIPEGIEIEDVTIGGGIALWNDTATQEELAAWAEHDRLAAERSAEYRRSQWEKLKAEFEQEDAEKEATDEDTGTRSKRG